jgi:RNA polymerase sigma-70 factor, ECF subfamily
MRKAIEKKLSGAFSDVFPFGGARYASLADRVIERLAVLSPHKQECR